MCRDLSCWLHGGEQQIAAIHERFGDDVEIEVLEVSCIGRCDIAPAATVDEQPVRADEVRGRRRAGTGDRRRAEAQANRRRELAQRPVRRESGPAPNARTPG